MSTQLRSLKAIKHQFNRQLVNRQLAKASGFTIIELLVSIGVLGLLVTLAAPNVSVFIQNQRVGAQAEGIAAALSVARATALSEAATVKVCWNPTDASVTVDDYEIQPGNMVVLYVDDDGDTQAARDFNYGEGSFIDDDDADNCVGITAQGRLEGGLASSLTFGVCRKSGDTEGSRAIVVSSAGRAINVENVNQADCS